MNFTNQNDIDFELEVDDKSRCKKSIMTKLKYYGIDSTKKLCFNSNKDSSYVVLLRNYDGFNLLISDGKFINAKLTVPESAIEYNIENLIFKKVKYWRWQ